MKVVKAKKTCPGVIFRACLWSHASQDGRIVFKRELRMMKRLSCLTGCDDPDCNAWIYDAIIEDVANNGLTNIDNIEHGKLYRAIRVGNCIDDGFHFEFVEIENQTLKRMEGKKK